MKPLFAFLGMLISMLPALAQSPGYDSLDINRVNARINSSGSLFWDMDGQSRYEVPKGSNVHSIFSYALWIGGLDGNQELHLAGDRHGSNGKDYWPGPVSDSIYYDSTFDATWNKVWKINKADIDYHRSHYWVAGYVCPPVILNWPGNGNTAMGQAHKLAPFYDRNLDDNYDALDGDYPLIKGDQAVFFILNDNRKPHTETGGKPLGVEIHAMAYAFNCPDDSALIYTTFIHYNMFNRSSNQYHDTYMGAYVDTDLGDAWDDYVGCDVGRGSFYTYNGDNVDGNGQAGTYGAFPPALSVTVLGGPALDPDNLDNPKVDGQGNALCDVSINGDNFGDGIIDNERYGLSRFVYTTNCASGPTCDPSVAADYYNNLCGKWKDGVNMQYGGNGHPNAGATGPDCNFMFPDLSDGCNWGTSGIQPAGYITGAGGTGVSWTEANVSNPPNDRRGTISMGPFTFQPGGQHVLDLALVWARQYTNPAALAAVELLKTRIDLVREAYEEDSVSCGGSFSGINSPPPTVSSLTLYPNPASDVLYVDYKGAPGQVDFVIVNILGETLLHGKLQSNVLSQVSVSHFPPGLYLMVVRDRGEVTGKRFVVR